MKAKEVDISSFSFPCDRMWPFAMIPIRQSLYQVGLFLVVSVFSLSVLQAGQNPSSEHDSEAALAAGRSAFNSLCAGCHGLDGSGSDKAVNISGSAKARHFSDAQLSSIISNGVPETGMPAFRSFNESQVRAVVGYLRSLQGKAEGRVLPGDPIRGKELFFGKGDCSALPHYFRTGWIPRPRSHGTWSHFIGRCNSRGNRQNTESGADRLSDGRAHDRPW